MAEIAYVNGVFCDLANAMVSVEDRGFQFADGVYEVIVAPHGRPFRLEQHLDRLKRSTDGIDLPVDYPALNLPGVIREGIERCGFESVLIYLQITRGVASRSYGIQVARLAGLPPKILARARQILEDLELGHGPQAPSDAAPQQRLFSPRQPVLEEYVATLDPDRMAPRAALEALYELRELLAAEPGDEAESE